MTVFSKLSPGINISEIDLTNTISNQATSIAGLVGSFVWGPANKVTSIASEADLVRVFGKPNTSNGAQWFSAASYLAYSNALKVVRVVSEDAPIAVNANGAGATDLIIQNEDVFSTYTFDDADNFFFAAKYPGALGNGLKVSVCPSASAFSRTLTITSTSGTTLTVADADSKLAPGDLVTGEVTSSVFETRQIVSVSSGTAVLDAAFSTNLGNVAVTVEWEYAQYFVAAPGTSDYVANRNGANDEVHVVVVDKDGKFTGINGEILEKYAFLSKASDAKQTNGATAYIKDAINNSSSYVYMCKVDDSSYFDTDWGQASTTTFIDGNVSTETGYRALVEVLSAGADGDTDAADIEDEVIAGYALFSENEPVDFLIAADHSVATITSLVSLAETRKDCVVFVSPEQADVVNAATPRANVLDYYSNTSTGLGNISSTYLAVDDNWKYMYDRYNDNYKWVPCNADVAGLYARTDQIRAPWFAAAGLNRGKIKNVIKLAWNPATADRDILYPKAINSVCVIPGEGAVLWGGKTKIIKNSAFSRVSVRRLFIVIEKAIAAYSMYTLFEKNDESTQLQFKSRVEQYLRGIKAGRGINDFFVKCDSENNTPQVIDNNGFQADIYIQPSRDIEFIQLNFIGTGTGVSFNEVIGKF